MKFVRSETPNHTLSQERRSQPRQEAQGQVMVTDESTGACAIGDLIDTSESGFRARFSFPAPSSGSICRFEHPFGQGRARVVWSRIADGWVEAGFFVRS